MTKRTEQLQEAKQDLEDLKQAKPQKNGYKYRFGINESILGSSMLGDTSTGSGKGLSLQAKKVKNIQHKKCKH